MFSFLPGNRAFELVNGQQDKIKISTRPNEYEQAEWWVDTCVLVQGLSKGDRGTISMSLKMALGDQKPTLMTAKGSVTQELWTRMTILGYMEELPMDGFPPRDR